jgi:transcriptional regulator with XRE-family HTH domain
MSDCPARRLAELLHGLKERDGRSYSALARRTGLSRSSLHRYCSGMAVPELFGTVETIARVCGATPAERDQLHRLWRSATAVPVPVGAAVARSRGGGDAAQRPVPASEPAREGDGARSRGGRLRRRPVLLVSAAVALALAAVAVVRGIDGDGDPSAATATGTETRAAPQLVSGPRWVRPPEPVPASFFGVTVNSRTGDLPTFRVGALRLWDSGTSWQRLQPERGVFEWTTLDRHVAAAGRAGLPVLLTFGATPGWASPRGPRAPYDDGSRASPPDDLRDWDTYVHAVASRYGDRIEAYELWNLAPSPRFYTGTPERLAEMTRRAARIIRAAAPRATVVCPGMGELWQPASRQFVTRFAAAGGYEPCDVAGVKLHQKDFDGDTPESVVELADIVDDTLRSAGVLMRMWNTGSAYRIVDAGRLDEQRAADYAVRFYLVGLYVRYERTYFYNWGGTKIPIVLQSVGGAPTRAALHVEELQSWLRGARITACGHGVPDGLPENVWQCRFLLAWPGRTGVPATIRWTESGTATVPAPPGATAVHRLDGSVRTVAPGADVKITESPALLR